jgi:hypothetical protein
MFLPSPTTGFTGGLPHARLGPPAAVHAGARGLARVTTPFPAQFPAARLVLTTGGWATRAARKPLSAATANGREGLLAAGRRRRPPVNSLAPRSQPGQKTARAMALGSVAAAPGKHSANALIGPRRHGPGLASLCPARRMSLSQAGAGVTWGHGTRPRSSSRTAGRMALRPAPASPVTPPMRASTTGAPPAAGEGSPCGCKRVWEDSWNRGVCCSLP